jgi:hypothetical protein
MQKRVLLGIVTVHVDPVIQLGLVDMVLPVPVGSDGLGTWHIQCRALPFRPERFGHLGPWNYHLPDSLVKRTKEIIEFCQKCTLSRR